MCEHKDEFKLILYCLEGRGYIFPVHEMARINENATHSCKKRNAAVKIPVIMMYKKLEYIMATRLFSMFFELIVHDI